MSDQRIKFYQTGTFTVGNRLLDPAQRTVQASGTDWDVESANYEGRLPTDPGHRLFVEGQRRGRLGPVELTAATRLTVASGRPRSVLGDTDLGIVYLLARGSAGRGPALSQANLRLAARWRGFDVDFCRGVAAAVFGSPDKVAFEPLKASTRFPALQARTIDLLARNTTWTFPREVLLRARFPGVLFYDGQAFMVPAASGVKSVAGLAGAKVCVEKGTTHVENLASWFAARNLAVERTT